MSQNNDLFAPPTQEELQSVRGNTDLYAPPTQAELSMVKGSKDSLLTNIGKTTSGLLQGAAEFANIPARPGELERVIRAAPKIIAGERKPSESLWEKTKRSFGEAERESYLPVPTVQELAAGFRMLMEGPEKKGETMREAYRRALKEQEEYNPRNKTAELIGVLGSNLVGMKDLAKTAKNVGVITGKAGKTLLTRARRLPKNFEEVMQQVDGEIVTAILERPEKIKELLNSGRITADDLAETVMTKLNSAGESLSSEIGKFRKVIEANDVDIINSTPLRRHLQNFEKRFRQKPKGKVEMVSSGVLDEKGMPIMKEKLTLEAGPSSLQRNEQNAIKEINELLQKEKLSPKETLNIIDKLNNYTDVESSAYSTKFTHEMRELKRLMQKSIKGTNPELDEWISANKAYGDFINTTNEIKRKFSSLGRTSFVENILGKNKGPTVKALNESFDAMAKSPLAKKDPTLVSFKNNFWESLYDIKAAQGLKARKYDIPDRIADNMRDIVRKYEVKGEKAGQLIGGATGAIVGGGSGTAAIGPAGMSGAPVTAYFGMKAGKAIGGSIGRAKGERIVDPYRMLDNVIKSKQASKGLKMFAEDISRVSKHIGRDGLLALFSMIGPNAYISEMLELDNEYKNNLR